MSSSFSKTAFGKSTKLFLAVLFCWRNYHKNALVTKQKQTLVYCKPITNLAHTAEEKP